MRKFQYLLCAILLTATNAWAADSEDEATAGALAVMEGFNALKTQGENKRAGALLERGSNVIQQSWINRQENLKNLAAPGKISIKDNMVSSPEGQRILQDFNSAYKMPGVLYLNMIANTGGTTAEIGNIMRGVSQDELSASLAEAQAMPAAEKNALLESSQSRQIFESAGIPAQSASLAQAAKPATTGIANTAKAAATLAQPSKSDGASWSRGYKGTVAAPEKKAPTEIVVKMGALSNINAGSADSSANSGRTPASTDNGTGHDRGEDNISNANYSASQLKLGINFGVFSTKQAVEGVKAMGSWYYNYSPFPNRADSNSTYDTVAWANKYDKEFVPMVIGRRFKFAAGNESCPITEYFANKDASGKMEKLCDPDEMAEALIKMKKLFLAGNQPRYLLAFNEPYIITPGAKAASNGISYAMTPWQAAHAFTRLQYAANKAGLKMVTPTTALGQFAGKPGEHPTDWMAMFLKRCYDMKDEAMPCDLDSIHAIAVHEYSCRSDHWESAYAKKGFQKMLIEKMKLKNGTFYGGRDWSAFIQSRKIWVTETNCNWEEDFLQAHAQGKYIRTQSETCKRATGQKSSHGEGSLAFFMNTPTSVIERFVWWNTYANPELDSDRSSVTESSRNRIEAVRLLNNNYQLTPSGRAYQQAWEDPSKLRSVNCD